MDATALFQLCTLFAITLIIIIEIQLGRDSAVWAPLLFAVVGYVLPQPRGVRGTPPELQEGEPRSLVGNGFVAYTVANKENDDDDSGFDDDDENRQQESPIDRARNVVHALWPTLLLLAGVAVWITVTPRLTPVNSSSRYNGSELTPLSDCEHHLATLFALAKPLDQCNRGDVACYERNRTLQDSRFSYILGDRRSRPLVLLSEKIWSGLFAHASDLLRGNGLIMAASTNDECGGAIGIGKGEYARTCGDHIYLSGRRHRTISIGRSELGRMLDTAGSLFHALLSCPADTLVL